jgi:outer membrane protein assembly complex protein YaeT
MMPHLATAAILLMIAAPTDFPGSVESLVTFSGKEVIEVRMEGVDMPDSEVQALLPQSEGEPMDPSAVREGIRNLYRTGLFRSVVVRAFDHEGGVIVLYEVLPRSWLSEVEFEGNLSIADGELLRNTDLTRKEEISETRLRENADKLRAYYSLRGFNESEVSFRIEDDGRDQRKVVFQIREGAGGTVTGIHLEGDAGMSRTKLLSLIASMPGEELDGLRIRKDVEKLQRYYRKNFYLTPKIKYSLVPDITYPGGTIIIFSIDRGPLFILGVNAPDITDSKRIRKRMNKVFKASTSIEVAKEGLKDELLNRYNEAGYPFAALDWDDEVTGPSERQVILNLNTGDKVIISRVDVRGVEYFPDSRIKDLIGLEIGRPFIRAELEKGIDALERAYRMNGFLALKTSLEPLNFIPAGDIQEIRIRIEVEEGFRTQIRNFTLESDSEDQDRLMELVDVSAGDPYVPELIEKGRDTILNALSMDGYLYAAVSLTEPVRNEDGSVDVKIIVHEGPRVRLGTVIITGNEQVKTEVIRLALDLERGDLLTQDKILKAQERIYRLGVMSSVDVRLVDPQEPAQRKDLIVTVRERPRYVIGLRLGYGSEDRLRGEASVAYRNVAGMARGLTLSGKASTIERRTSLLYNHPWFTSRPIVLSASLSDIVEERDSYSRDALSAAVDFTRMMSDRTEASLGYVFEGLRLFDVSPGAQLSPDDEGRTDVAALIGEITYDSRDDFLDPWSGLLGDLRVEVASRYFVSKAEYYKAELAARKYMSIGGARVLAGLLRLGAVISYGQSEEVLISKRFFLGGQNSVRGYALDGLGPRDADGDPIGGNFMVNANMELRYPVFKSIRGVIFVDSGSVWLERGGDGFNLLSSIGAGLRWTSPIGPLSLDYGYKLNPVAQDEDDRHRWHFSIGHAF